MFFLLQCVNEFHPTPSDCASEEHSPTTGHLFMLVIHLVSRRKGDAYKVVLLEDGYFSSFGGRMQVQGFPVKSKVEREDIGDVLVGEPNETDLAFVDDS